MEMGFLSFVLIPLLIYTYFWLNPLQFATFIEGFSKYLVEIYLGYKEWKIERATKKVYRQYLKDSEKLAKQHGISGKVVKLYFKTYEQEDWREIKQIARRVYEERHRDVEETMREMLLS